MVSKFCIFLCTNSSMFFILIIVNKPAKILYKTENTCKEECLVQITLCELGHVIAVRKDEKLPLYILLRKMLLIDKLL